MEIEALAAAPEAAPILSNAGSPQAEPVDEEYVLPEIEDADADFQNIDDILTPSGDEGEEALPEIPRSSTNKGKALIRFSQVAKLRATERLNKENFPKPSAQAPQSTAGTRRFIDEQEGARRVEFGEGFDTQVTLPESSRTAPPSSRKRQREVEASEDDDDEFQQDSRPINSGRRSEAPVRKRARQFGSSASLTRRQDPRPVLVEEAQQEHPQASVQLSTQRFERQQGRENVMAAKARIPKELRGKNPWTEDQERKLIELIEEHGCNWAFLKSLSDDYGHQMFPGRSNVDLKDKARNLKIAFIK